MRRWAGIGAAFFGAASVVVIASAPSQASTPSDATQIVVTGSSLSGLNVNPLSISPAFSPTTQDYVVRCQTGVNNLLVGLIGSGVINIGSQSGTALSVPVAVGENQAVVVTAPAPGSPLTTIQYWIRCLPHDFPVIQVNQAIGATAGWYLTGNVTTATDNSDGGYSMILDGNGTPVWYQAAPSKSADLELLQPNVLAWAPIIFNNPAEAFTLDNLATQTYTKVFAPTPPTDLHELIQLADGSMMIISAPLRTGVDLSSLGAPFNTTTNVIDCLVQRFDSQGHILWQWSQFDHNLLSEVDTSLSSVNAYGSGVAADIFHCNSIDFDPSTGNVLVSARHEDAVYLISGAADGHVIWKLGGTSSTKDSTAQILSIHGDTFSGFSGQHDARFEPNGDVSLYDDRSKVSGAARGIQYHIDTTAGTATLDFQYSSPDGLNSMATGSFRRYNNGNDNLIGWGFRTGSGLTEVDASGNVLFDMKFPKGDKEYRVVKVDRSAIDANLLRANAGLPRPVSSTVNWQPLGGQLVGAPAATSSGPNHQDVFARGADNQLWHMSWDGTNWSTWQPLGGTLTSAPAAIAQGGQIDVFVRGPDYGLWHLNWNGTSWGTWQSLGGVIAGNPTVASMTPGRLDVFARGYDNMLYHISAQGTTWAPWSGMGLTLVNDPAAASWGANRLDVWMQGGDKNLYHTYWDGAKWNLPDGEGGLLANSPAAAASAVGQMTVVAPGAAGVLERSTYNGGWMGWQPLGISTGSSASVVAHDASTVSVFVTGTDNQLWWGMLPIGQSGSFAQVESRPVIQATWAAGPTAKPVSNDAVGSHRSSFGKTRNVPLRPTPATDPVKRLRR